MLKDLLGSRLRAKALGWLFSHPDKRYFVRQIAEIIDEDPGNLTRELAKLAELGVLVCEVSGKQVYYQANADCAVFEELKGLAVKTAGVADVIREALAPLSGKIAVAFLFGSHATGDFTARSDVDLMVIGSVTFGEVSNVLGPPEERLAREINPTVYPEAEFSSKVRNGHHFVTSVMSGAKIFLVGDEYDLAGLAQ